MYLPGNSYQLLCYYLCFLLFGLHSTSADDPTTCPVLPFAVPLRNCTFDTGVLAWGILVEVGTPGQRLCLSPSTVSTTTLVSQQSLCAISDPDMSKLECESLRGGFFNENQSSTWTDVSNQDYNSTRSDPTWEHFNPAGITKVGYDTLHFPRGDGMILWGYGFALNQRGNQSNEGMLGLGIDSVFLDTAWKMNLTPSKSWSLDSGSQSLAQPRHGEIVFGGYNQGKIDGSYRWKPISDVGGDRPCPLRVMITDIYITLENGTQMPLKPSSENIAACIEPYDNIFRFTPEMLSNWKQITGYDPRVSTVYTVNNSQNLTYTELGLVYNSSRAFNFSLTVALDDGCTTTLPSYELLSPLRGWNVVGEKTQVPGVDSVPILDIPTGAGEIPTLGKVYLSQTYLAVDYEKKQFGLAKAAKDPTAEKLIPFHCNPIADGDDKSKAQTRVMRRTSALVLIGALLLISLGICIIAWHLRRKRKREAKTSSSASAGTHPLGWDGTADEIYELDRASNAEAQEIGPASNTEPREMEA